jgi:hypothetical protein
VSDSAKTYVSPAIKTLGSLADLTLAFNKVGSASDAYSAITDGVIVGTVVPVS